MDVSLIEKVWDTLVEGRIEGTGLMVVFVEEVEEEKREDEVSDVVIDLGSCSDTKSKSLIRNNDILCVYIWKKIQQYLYIHTWSVYLCFSMK